MVSFEPTRATPVVGGHNEGLDFGNLVAKSEGTRDRYHVSGGGKGIKLELWHCEWEHMNINCPKRAEER